MKLILIFLMSCTISKMAFAILSGTPMASDEMTSVFKVRTYSNPTTTCTGVLFESNKIITAFHCVALYKTSDLYVENMFCEKNNCVDLKIKDVLVPQKANLAYKNLNSFRNIDSSNAAELDLLKFLKGDDLAIIKLENKTKIPPTKLISELMINSLSFPLPHFSTLMCGFGIYSPPLTSWANAQSGQKHCDNFSVDVFDENYYIIPANTESSVAKGDSGSGLIIEVHGKQYIYGVLSGYGSSKGLLGQTINNWLIMKENGYAVPVNKELIKNGSFESHKPKFFRSRSTDFLPREA